MKITIDITKWELKRIKENEESLRVGAYVMYLSQKESLLTQKWFSKILRACEKARKK